MQNKIQKNKYKSRSVKSIRNYILIVICGILAVSSIFMTIETATVGSELAKIEKTQNLLSNQKRDLDETLVKTLSITELQQKGADLGFVKADNLVYVSTGENLETASVVKLP